MFAIIETGGKQYKVTEGQVIDIEKIERPVGDKIKLDVLLISDGDVVKAGTPILKDAVCEEAISLISKADSIHAKNQEDNITSISLGAGSVSYRAGSNSDEKKLLASSTALYLVKKWIKKGYYMPF